MIFRFANLMTIFRAQTTHMKKMQWRTLLALSVPLLLMACKKTKQDPPIVITPPPDLGFKVVGYFPYYRDPASVPDIKFRMTNVVNYAFATVNGSGALIVNSPATLAAVAAKAKSNNAKVLLSINGTHTDFSRMAADVAVRNNFIRSVMDVVRASQLHGVDVDWEFPKNAA